jgi:hypothetical protein
MRRARPLRLDAAERHQSRLVGTGESAGAEMSCRAASRAQGKPSPKRTLLPIKPGNSGRIQMIGDRAISLTTNTPAQKIPSNRQILIAIGC